MNPFSPLYYISKNRMKCAPLIFLIFLCYGVYLGGLYVTNARDNWTTAIEYEDHYVTVANINSIGYDRFLKNAEASGKIDIIPLAGSNGLLWNTVMGFENGSIGLSFKNAEDFRRYCQYLEIDCNFSLLKPGTMVMSSMLAKNKGYSIGDKLDHRKEENIVSDMEFELVALTNENGYFSYFITGEDNYDQMSLLIGKSISKNELCKIVFDLNKNDDVLIIAPLETQISEQFEIMNVIYVFIVLLLSVIMAVTVNSAFVYVYQGRTCEFAVFRAIGISKNRMIAKIAGELLLMDLAALIGGGAVFFLILYFLNHLVLYPCGMYLCYYDPVSLISLMISNSIIILPLIITRSRQMLKADICDY